MGNRRANGERKDPKRVAGRFVALPIDVLESQAYLALSHPARSLLIELARQYMGSNNGQLIASLRFLRARGWTSSDVLNRARRDLLESGLVFETVKGHRPNKASWFACTWWNLDANAKYDYGVDRVYRRGSYKQGALLGPKNAVLTPRGGLPAANTAPSGGALASPSAPWSGPMRTPLDGQASPRGEHHLEAPSGGMAQRGVLRRWRAA